MVSKEERAIAHGVCAFLACLELTLSLKSAIVLRIYTSNPSMNEE